MQVTSTDQKLKDITSAVVKVLTNLCSDCAIKDDIIDMQSFACYPESPTHVTYRARLGGTSETESGSLISLLEDWVNGRASVIVTGVLMTVDSECSVAISSLSEEECSTMQTPTTDPTTSTMDPTTSSNMTTTDSTTNSGTAPSTETTASTSSQSSSDNTAAVIGGVVAVVIVLIIAVTIIAIIVIIALILKSRHGDMSIKKTKE